MMPAKFDLAVDLTRICFPYLLFMSLTALQSGVLNSLNRFTAAAAAPILLNLVMIASNVVAWYLGTGNTAATGYIFAWGIFAAGIAQYLLLADRLPPRRHAARAALAEADARREAGDRGFRFPASFPAASCRSIW